MESLEEDAIETQEITQRKEDSHEENEASIELEKKHSHEENEDPIELESEESKETTIKDSGKKTPL